MLYEINEEDFVSLRALQEEEAMSCQIFDAEGNEIETLFA